MTFDPNEMVDYFKLKYQMKESQELDTVQIDHSKFKLIPYLSEDTVIDWFSQKSIKMYRMYYYKTKFEQLFNRKNVNRIGKCKINDSEDMKYLKYLLETWSDLKSISIELEGKLMLLIHTFLLSPPLFFD